ncbi:hypothetical protein BDW68DRAFT_183029 [Aspergillus falconensis]
MAETSATTSSLANRSSIVLDIPLALFLPAAMERLDQIVARLALAPMPLREPIQLDGASISTFFHHFRTAGAAINELAHHHLEQWAGFFDAFEGLAADNTLFAAYKASPAYATEFSAAVATRNYRISNQRSAARARGQIPTIWPNHGRALLAIHPDVEGWHRNLLTFAHKEPDEDRALQHLNRVVVDRLQAREHQIGISHGTGLSSSTLPSQADLIRAAQLPADFSPPAAEELHRLRLFVTSDGLLTRTPPHEQSYAQTLPPSTPQRSQRHVPPAEQTPERVDTADPPHPSAAGSPAAHFTPINRPPEEVGSPPAAPASAPDARPAGPSSPAPLDNAAPLLADRPSMEDDPPTGTPRRKGTECPQEEQELDELDRQLLGETVPDAGWGQSPADQVQGIIPPADAARWIDDGALPKPPAGNRRKHFLYQPTALRLRLPDQQGWDTIMKDVCERLLLPEDPRNTIRARGSVDLPVYEDFLGDGDLHQQVMEEVRVLEHHTRSEGSTCWAIQHSILQQILHCDALHYLLNVLLRPHCRYQLHAHPQPVIRPAPGSPPPSLFACPSPSCNWSRMRTR